MALSLPPLPQLSPPLPPPPSPPLHHQKIDMGKCPSLHIPELRSAYLAARQARGGGGSQRRGGQHHLGGVSRSSCARPLALRPPVRPPARPSAGVDPPTFIPRRFSPTGYTCPLTAPLSPPPPSPPLQAGKANYERELLDLLEGIAAEADRKILRAQRRLEEVRTPGGKGGGGEGNGGDVAARVGLVEGLGEATRRGRP